MVKPRIAVGGILTECNHMGGVPTELAQFEQSELVRGAEFAGKTTGVVGGGLSVLHDRGAEIVPLLFASACPGGPVTAECYDALKHELIELLRASLPVQGVLLPLHGAATAENAGDLEGDLIRTVREVVGADVRVVATLDLHAHVTEEMVRHADGLVAWETYPHRDALTTGERGAALLMDAIEGRSRPTMAMAKVPVVTGAIRGSTEWGDPFGRVMQFGKAFEARRDVLSVSVFMVHPNLDLPSLGSGGLVITDGDPALAEELARRIAEQYWSLRHELEPEVHSPGAATAAALAAPGGPHILVETADCCGGGAAGDSAASLKALLRAEVAEASLVPIVDAEAARACHAAGVGKTISLQLGHRHDPKWGEPVQVTGKVARLSDGRFVYTGGIWGGVEGNMGLTAVLQIGAISVLIASNPTYDWADEQYRSVGLDPAAAKIVVAKNPMNYRMAYEGCAKGFFVLDTPGPTPPTVRHYPYRNLARPYFPVDTEIPGLRPTVYRSLRCT